MRGVAFDQPATVNLRVVVTLDANGSPIRTQAQVIADIVATARYFEPHGIVIRFESYETTDTIPSVDVTNAVRSHAIFSTTASTLTVLYVHNYVDGGGVAWSNGSGVMVALNGRAPILAHELGHAFGLSHVNIGGPAGDRVDDTLYDPGPGSKNREGCRYEGGTCVPSTDCNQAATCATCSGACDAPHETVTPDPRQIMASYCANLECFRFTPGQGELMRCMLRTGQRRLTATQCLDPCPAGRTCSGGSCVCLDTECNSQCVSLGSEAHCKSCDDSCGDGKYCRGRVPGCVEVPILRSCQDDCDAESRACYGRCNSGVMSEPHCNVICRDKWIQCQRECVGRSDE